MAKRFTDTEQWDKEWFMKLSPKLKCLVKLVRDKCDLCGVWSPNFIIASAYVGEPVNEEELISIDGGKQFQKLKSGKIFCIGFISFQYGQLSEKSPVHRKILHLLTTHKIGYKHPINRVQEKEEEKEKDKEEEKEGEVRHELQIFISEKLSNVSKLEKQLTFEECERILAEFDRLMIVEVLGAMENKKDLSKKYTSVNLTLRNWIKNHKPNGLNSTANGNGNTEIKIGRMPLSEIQRFISNGEKFD